MLKFATFLNHVTKSSVQTAFKVNTRLFSLASIRNNQSGIVEIDDLKRSKKSPEDIERCKLAAIYRLVDSKGWSWSIYNHITTRSPDNRHNFLINPYGLLYSEITASSLLKVDSKCAVIDKGTTTYGLNKAGFVLHSTIHDARDDINAIIHIHTGIAAGLASLKHGFLPISQEALICNQVSYHDYGGILVDEEMRKKIISDLGPRNKLFILRNHGLVACGATLEEAWFFLTTFMTAAEIQYHAMAASNGMENIIVPPRKVLEQVQRVVQMGGVSEKSSDGIEWKIGEMETEAEMRRLDFLGYKTGYPYKKPPPVIQ